MTKIMIVSNFWTTVTQNKQKKIVKRKRSATVGSIKIMSSPFGRSFESGSDHDSAYDDIDQSFDQSTYDQHMSTTKNQNNQSIRLFDALLLSDTNKEETTMTKRTMRRAIMLPSSSLSLDNLLLPFPNVAHGFLPKYLSQTISSMRLKRDETIDANRFEEILSNLELGNEDDLFGAIHPEDLTSPSPQRERRERTGGTETALSWVTDEEEELLYDAAEEDEKEEEAKEEKKEKEKKEKEKKEKMNIYSPSMTNDEESLARQVVDIVDARLRSGFEERDRAIIAVQSTLTSFVEILKNQEETYDFEKNFFFSSFFFFFFLFLTHTFFLSHCVTHCVTHCITQPFFFSGV